MLGCQPCVIYLNPFPSGHHYSTTNWIVLVHSSHPYQFTGNCRLSAVALLLALGPCSWNPLSVPGAATIRIQGLAHRPPARPGRGRRAYRKRQQDFQAIPQLTYLLLFRTSIQLHFGSRFHIQLVYHTLSGIISNTTTTKHRVSPQWFIKLIHRLKLISYRSMLTLYKISEGQLDGCRHGSAYN